MSEKKEKNNKFVCFQFGLYSVSLVYRKLGYTVWLVFFCFAHMATESHVLVLSFAEVVCSVWFGTGSHECQDQHHPERQQCGAPSSCKIVHTGRQGDLCTHTGACYQSSFQLPVFIQFCLTQYDLKINCFVFLKLMIDLHFVCIIFIMQFCQLTLTVLGNRFLHMSSSFVWWTSYTRKEDGTEWLEPISSGDRLGGWNLTTGPICIWNKQPP